MKHKRPIITVETVKANAPMVEWFMGRVHVGTSNRQVCRMFFDRMKPHSYTRLARKAMYRLALHYHKRNFIEYAAVMSGKI